MKIISALIKWLRRTLRRSGKSEPMPRAKPKPPKPARADDGGVFYFRETILDRLPQIHDHLRELRKVDADAYEFHRAYGARIVPSGAILAHEDEALIPERLPASGMYYLGGHGADEMAGVKFIYFCKFAATRRVKPNRGEVYDVSASFHDGKTPVIVQFYVSVDDGDVTLCSSEHKSYNVLRGRCQTGRGTETFRIPVRRWGIPERLAEWAMDLGETPQNMARLLFSAAANGAASGAGEDILVRCSDGDTVAMFNVSMGRTPYFFKDRETGLASDGKRKRIFHSVREHERIMPDGSKQKVKSHYRGERFFTWGGDSVAVSVPRHHHPDILTGWDVGAIEGEDDDIPDNHLGARAVGEMLAAQMGSESNLGERGK